MSITIFHDLQKGEKYWTFCQGPPFSSVRNGSRHIRSRVINFVHYAILIDFHVPNYKSLSRNLMTIYQNDVKTLYGVMKKGCGRKGIAQLKSQYLSRSLYRSKTSARDGPCVQRVLTANRRTLLQTLWFNSQSWWNTSGDMPWTRNSAWHVWGTNITPEISVG